MYPVTDLYKNAIVKNDRDFTCDIRIEHSNGTLELTDVDLSQGSITYTESSQSGDEFTIGSTVASDISFTIFNKPEYEDIQFMGATVFVSIGLFVQEGTEHFLQPSQPSRMKGFDDKWEYVPLGRFNIDDVNIKSNTIGLKAMDNMINLDKPYSLSKLSYPATLYQIYTNICSVGDISVGTLNFPNKDYLVNERPSGELTLRDVLGYVAELSGTFAKCDRTGRLELKWYEPTDIEISPDIRYDFIPSDDIVQIKGVMASTEDTTYLAGNEDYAIDLSENPLLQGDYENALPNIFENIKHITFTPYTSNFKGNPAIQAGDMIVQVDKNGKEYNTIVTKMVYKYRGRTSLEAKGLPDISKGYKGSTNKKLAEIRRKIDIEVGDKITDLEQSILEATELITGELGGYVLKRENELLIMDNPDPNLAVKVWRWNLGGLGYSNTGVDGTYELAMTMNGAINANFITTGLLSANLIHTGLLQSEDGSTWINLDNGEFNLKNSMSYIDETLHLTGAIQEGKVYGGVDINSETGIHVEFTEGGSATIGQDSILVENIDGSYTKIDGRGINRVLSIPLYEEVSTGTDLIDNFNSGDINDARINWNSNARSELSVLAGTSYQWISKNDNMRSHIKVTTEDYYSSPYSAKISNLIPNGDRYDITSIYGSETVGGVPIPKFKYETWFHYGSRMSYWLENYTPTKNTTFSMRYKYIDCPNGDAYLNIRNLTDSTTKTIYLTNNSWSEVTHQLIKNNVYRFSITLRLEKHLYFEDYDTQVNRSLSQYRPTSTNYLYIDDIIYETNLTGKVISGYKDGEIPYDPFFHIGVIEPFTGTGKTVEIPEYFKGMDYKVYVFANGKAPNVPSVGATDNTIPNITFQGGSNQYSCNFIVVV